MLKQILSKIPRNKLSSKSDGHNNQGGRGAVNNSVSLSGPGAKNPNSGPIPIVQGRFPSGVKTAPFPIGGCNDFIEPLPSFRDVPNSEKQNLFIRKLVLCCTLFDFSDTTKNTREKEIKRQTLIELVDFVSSSTSKFSELAIEEIVRMVSANIFRALPPSTHEIVSVDLFDPDEDEPSMEPAWSHLQSIYDLFLRFITSTEMDAKVVKRYVDHSFILKLIDLFESEDSRERECLKTILHRIYGKFMVHRPFIRKSINNVLYRFIFETERHSGIAELLEILGSIINGFALPLKEEHKLFLVRVLIPLHKPKCVSFYHRQLTYCITQFVEKEMKLADTVIRGLLRYWPLTNSQKEVLFLGELEEVLEATQPAEFQRCMFPLFRQIGKCISSSNFQVAERALFLWNNDHIIHLVTHNLEVILPLVFPALETNTKNHWNQAVHSLTLNTRKLLMELDHDLFQECKQKFDEEEAKKNMMRERRELIWQRLDDLALTSVPCKSPSLVPQSKKV